MRSEKKLFSKMFRSGSFSVATFLLCSSGFASADVEAGREAANRGDFSTAVAEWKPLAQAGDAEAQYLMGRLYANGDGVARNFKEAFRWFEKAGRQGHKKAQSSLSKMYKYGDGVKANAKLSEQWKSGFIPAESSEVAKEFDGPKEIATQVPRVEVRETPTPAKQVEVPTNKEFPRSDKFPLSEFPVATPKVESSAVPTASTPTERKTTEPLPSPIPTEGTDSAFPSDDKKKSFDYERPTPESDLSSEIGKPIPTKIPERAATPLPKANGVAIDEVL